jgi:hypothetical protein
MDEPELVDSVAWIKVKLPAGITYTRVRFLN